MDIPSTMGFDNPRGCDAGSLRKTGESGWGRAVGYDPGAGRGGAQGAAGPFCACGQAICAGQQGYGAGGATQFCDIDEAGKNLMRMAVRQRPQGTRLSARSYHRVLKLDRTIADLAGRRQSRYSTWPKRYSIGPGG